jgi:hypothetical protein
MQDSTPSIQDLPELRAYVHHELCQQNELEVGVFTFTERLLHQGNTPCGMFFCLHGPRSVKLVAIWDCRRNSIFFYSSTGERVATIRLRRAPTLAGF